MFEIFEIFKILDHENSSSENLKQRKEIKKYIKVVKMLGNLFPERIEFIASFKGLDSKFRINLTIYYIPRFL